MNNVLFNVNEKENRLKELVKEIEDIKSGIDIFAAAVDKKVLE